MQTAFVRGLAALLVTLTLSACGPQVKPFPAKTPAEIKQLTDVTDGALAVVRNPQDNEALRRAVAALSAARPQYDQHKAAVVSKENAEMLGCIDAHGIEVLNLENMIAKRDEAARQHDAATVDDQNAMLWSLAADMGGCAAKSSIVLIDMEQRPEALAHGAVVVSEMYAMVEIARAAMGLKVPPLLQDQIRAYETVVQRLGPERQLQFVTDALPKLKTTLAALESSPAQAPSASR